MTPEVISAIGVIILGVCSGFFAMMRYIIKTMSELKPNGGSSLKDKVEVNTARLERIESRIDHIYEILSTRRRK